MAEGCDDGVHGCGDFGGVGVASVDYGHGEGMGGEEEDDVLSRFFWIGEELGLDVFCKSLYEAGVCGPAVYDAPVYSTTTTTTIGPRGGGGFEAGAPFPEFVQGGAGCGAAVLWVLGECYRSSLFAESVFEEFVVGFFGQGIGVPEREVGLMGRAFRVCFVEDFTHLGGLMLAPFPDWGTSADGGVLGLDFGCSAAGD